MTAPESLAAITKTSLRDAVLTALRDAIIAGEMRAGEMYTGPELAKRLGVSSTPVREAMVNLAEENLITPVPYRGFQVRQISAKELLQILEIRLLLEPPLARAVTPLIPEKSLAKLRKLAQTTVTRARSGQLASFLEADREFHLAVLGFTDNERLLQIISKLRLQTRLIGLNPMLDHDELVESALEHVALVDLIEQRDAHAVEALWRKHLEDIVGIWAIEA